MKILEAEIAALKKDNGCLRLALETANAEVQRLATTVVNRDATIAQLQKEVQRLTKELEAATAELGTCSVSCLSL